MRSTIITSRPMRLAIALVATNSLLTGCAIQDEHYGNATTKVTPLAVLGGIVILAGLRWLYQATANRGWWRPALLTGAVFVPLAVASQRALPDVRIGLDSSLLIVWFLAPAYLVTVSTTWRLTRSPWPDLADRWSFVPGVALTIPMLPAAFGYDTGRLVGWTLTTWRWITLDVAWVTAAGVVAILVIEALVRRYRHRKTPQLASPMTAGWPFR